MEFSQLEQGKVVSIEDQSHERELAKWQAIAFDAQTRGGGAKALSERLQCSRASIHGWIRGDNVPNQLYKERLEQTLKELPYINPEDLDDRTARENAALIQEAQELVINNGGPLALSRRTGVPRTTLQRWKQGLGVPSRESVNNLREKMEQYPPQQPKEIDHASRRPPYPTTDR